MTDAVILTQEQLEEALRYWQRVLRLQDWQVTIEIVRQSKMKDANSRSCAWIDEWHKVTLIQILDPADYSPDESEPQDMEYCVVHELLHLHMERPGKPMRRGHDRITEEQAIDAIAKALVRLRREVGV